MFFLKFNHGIKTKEEMPYSQNGEVLTVTGCARAHYRRSKPLPLVHFNRNCLLI